MKKKRNSESRARCKQCNAITIGAKDLCSACLMGNKVDTSDYGEEDWADVMNEDDKITGNKDYYWRK